VALAARLVDGEGTHEIAPDRAALETVLAEREFFWLDLHAPSDEEIRAVGALFGFHPLAVEDSLQFGQRAKLEHYEDYVFLVVFGWAPDADGLVEVHCYYSERFLVTVHRDEAPGLDDARPRCGRTLAEGADYVLVLHQVVDGLVDSFRTPLEVLDDRLEQIETEIVERPSPKQVTEILSMRRRLASMRKAITPQRELFGRLAAGIESLPGMTAEAERYFRDIYDHLIRLGEMFDTSRELMSSALDVYLSSASNRLGVVTKQLTVIATIFLPLAFITGFFGQNFPWMVDHVGSWQAFVLLGIGIPVLGTFVILAVFRRRGWF
jgi:magnesium transporter